MDRQTGRQTHDDSTYHASIASHEKNWIKTKMNYNKLALCGTDGRLLASDVSAKSSKSRDKQKTGTNIKNLAG